MLAHHHNDTSKFTARKAATILEPNGVEPELGSIGVTLDMNMRRLDAVPGEEEAPVRPNTKNRRHAGKVGESRR